MIAEIKIKKLNDFAKMPTRGSEYAAGYDLYAATDDNIIIMPHSTVKISTGLSFEIPEQTFVAIFARSGIATKRGLRPANCVGVIDSDYRGPIVVALHNDTNETMEIAFKYIESGKMQLNKTFNYDYLENKKLLK